MNDKYKLFTFNSTHHALLMEKTLKDNGYAVRLIPIPRALSASCGLAARINIGDFEAVEKIVNVHGIDVAGVCDY